MLRERISQSLTWADKTMSVLRAHQLKACEQRVVSLPFTNLFSDCDDTQAELFWAASYNGQEHPWTRKLHTIHELRARVMIDLPAETALLSPEEHSLVERLLAFGGEADLIDWNELDAAESLVRRLWCSLVNAENSQSLTDRRRLHMPHELMPALMMIISSKSHEEIRHGLMQVDQTIRARLYITGMLPMDQALSMLRDQVLKNTYADDEALAMRYLRTTYDCTYDNTGRMMLLHPGLAEPERLFDAPASSMPLPPLSQEELNAACRDLLPCEKDAFDRLVGQLRQATMPDVTEDEAAEDLLMLAKQGVSQEEMNDVLSSLLMVQPTRDMLESVRQLRMAAPRWGTMRTGVMQ